MKNTELRIGNWIYSINGMKQKEVVEIEMLRTDNFIGGYLETEPIPLTEDWLLKFGFEHKPNEYYLRNILSDIEDSVFDFVVIEHDDDNDFSQFSLVIMEKDKNGETQSSYVPKFFYNVHQLQNLFHALTQQELTIK